MLTKKSRPQVVSSRIDRLFADLGQEAAAFIDSKIESPSDDHLHLDTTTLPGWKWACDLQGNYTQLSGEVEAGLNRTEAEFIGQPLCNYGLTLDSSRLLLEVMTRTEMPQEVDVEYFDRDGNIIPVRIYIHSAPGMGDAADSGWQGYAQPLIPSETRSNDSGAVLSPALQAGKPPLAEALGKKIRKSSTPQRTSEGVAKKNQRSKISPAKKDLVHGGNSTLAIPFQVQENEIGLLEILDDTPGRVWSEDERRLVEQVADQLSLALENARLFQETQAALAETRTLYAITSASTRTLELRETLTGLLEQVLEAVNLDSGLISMVDQLTDELHLVVQQNLPEAMNQSLTTNGLQGTLCDLVYRKRDTISIPDFDDKEGIPDYAPSITGLYQFGFRSYLGVPLISKGRVLGTLCTFGKQARPGQEAGISLMQVAGQQIGIAIENAQLFEETQARADELAVLNEMGRTLAASLNVHEVTEALYTYVSRLMNTYSFFVSLYDEEKQDMELPVVFTSGTRIFPARRKLGSALSDYVIRNKVSLLLNGDDITEQQEKLGVRFVGLGDAKPAKSWLGVPLLYGNQILGAVVVQSVEKPFLYNETHRRLLTAVASQAAIAIQNARLFEQTQAALGETANLYQASAELNTAQTYEEILNVLRRNSIAGKQAHHVNLSYFDRPWVAGSTPEWVDVLARWTDITDQEFMGRYPLQAYPALAQLLKPDETLILEDISSDTRLDDTTRDVFAQLYQAASALFVPVMVGFQWVGFINANYPEKMTFTDEEIRRVMVLAGQAAVAIQNLRSVAIAESQAREAQRRSQELALINRVVSAMVSSADLRQVLSAVAGELVIAFHLAHASIALLRPERSHLTIVAESSSGNEAPALGAKIPIQGNQAVDQVLRNRQSIMVTGAQSSSLVAPMQVRLHERGIQTIAFFPIIAGGDVVGTISLDSTEKDRVFTPQEMTLAETLVGQISTSIQNANPYEQNINLLDETRRRVQELSVLFELSQSLAGATLSSHEIAYIIGQYFIRIMEYPEVSVSLFDVQNGELQYLEKLVLDGKTQEPVRIEEAVPVRNISEIPAAAKVLQTMKPLVVKLSDKSLDYYERKYMLENGLKSQVALPLTVKGLVLGMILLSAGDRERDFSADQLNLAMTLANSAATALENARLYEGQRQTAEQLRELDKLKSQFLANMSHELRTPLNSIIGFSRVILKGIDGPVSDLQKQDLAAINSAGQHLLQLINDVLDISKIEAGKMELAFDDHVNLADLITSAMSTAIGLVKDKPIKLIKQIPPNLPVVRADPTRIRQVLINFLSNAAKFTEEGTTTISAETVTDDMGLPEVMVKVTDTGTGIAKQDQDRLFQPFSQVDASPTRKVGGSGLGLSISRLLIDLHKGRIGVDSDLGTGSTFYFTLPLIHMDAPQAIGENLMENLGNERVILTIDDDRAVLNLYERYLVDHGYRVIPLIDPSQAVPLARQTRPFAITLDIMMPSIDGWTVLTALKQDPVTKDIPVIICSIVDHLEKGFSLGAVGYLTKPLLEEDLLKALHRLNGEGEIQEILIVDDDINDLRLVQRILEQRTRYKVRVATGGLEGLVAVQSHPPQAVILDLFMPDMDGFSLLETMRSDAILSNIPVIIFTAGDLTEEQHARLSDFSKMMLHKSSFNENELLNNLDTLLSKIKAD